MRFEVSTRPCPCEVFLPNVFTPNGDGFNEVFLPEFESGVTDARWTIKDRWGAVRHEAAGLNATWDGTWQGQPLPAGVYYCFISYPCITGDGRWESRQTAVTLLR
ncbi:MAG: gliding motility-associated C-terminal domain-containing protein [Bacteroidetes bacterium]|nr:MAG: gliding motility-associated C-terminal domain-containing protein [Bacteroidota bacterium]